MLDHHKSRIDNGFFHHCDYVAVLFHAVSNIEKEYRVLKSRSTESRSSPHVRYCVLFHSLSLEHVLCTAGFTFCNEPYLTPYALKERPLASAACLGMLKASLKAFFLPSRPSLCVHWKNWRFWEMMVWHLELAGWCSKERRELL